MTFDECFAALPQHEGDYVDTPGRPLLFGMLGLGSYRTAEKVRGWRGDLSRAGLAEMETGLLLIFRGPVAASSKPTARCTGGCMDPLIDMP